MNIRFLLFVLAATCSLLPLPRLNAVELVGHPTIETTATEVTIRWKTDTASGSRVQVTPTPAVAPETPSGSSSDHFATLRGLKSGVTYTVAVGSARVWLATNLVTTSGFSPATPTRAGPVAAETKSTAATKESKPLTAPPTRKIWGNMPSLQDHFDRHGGDFGAKNPDDYARLAWEFLQRGKAGANYLAKEDEDGVVRVFDPKTRSFAAYNRDGTAKTFFKPNSRDYFDRQPGKPFNLNQWK